MSAQSTRTDSVGQVSLDSADLTRSRSASTMETDAWQIRRRSQTVHASVHKGFYANQRDLPQAHSPPSVGRVSMDLNGRTSSPPGASNQARDGNRESRSSSDRRGRLESCLLDVLVIPQYFIALKGLLCPRILAITSLFLSSWLSTGSRGPPGTIGEPKEPHLNVSDYPTGAFEYIRRILSNGKTT